MGTRQEEWRQIIWWPEHEVSSHGRVRRTTASGSVCAGQVLKPHACSAGYLRIQLRPLVHALVAEAFLGSRPPGYVVNHKDGDKQNNSVENLEWVTRAENNDHAIRSGLGGFGSVHGQSKLTETQVLEIRARYGGAWGEQGRLADEYGVTQGLVSKIVRGEIWTHLPLGPITSSPTAKSGAGHGRARLTGRKVRSMRRRYGNGESVEQIAARYGMDRQVIRNIVRGKTWKHVTPKDVMALSSALTCTPTER